jgi:hypothetical protein
MEDWEDWGLSLAVFVILVGCLGFGFVKMYICHRPEERLLDNPV